jgi:hypothetical protein
LSPGYDIVFSQGRTGRDLAIVAGRNGHRASIENDWEGLCVDNGFTAPEIDRPRICFIACDEALPGSATFAANAGLL